MKDELGKLSDERSGLQKSFEAASKARDEALEKLKATAQREPAQMNQPAQVPPSSDAYWAGILRAKTDLEMQLTDVRNALKTVKIDNEALQRDKSSLQLDITNLSNEKRDLLRQLDYNQKLLDSMSQEVVRERNDKVKIQDSFKIIKNESQTLVRQLKSLNNRKANLDKKVQDLQEGKTSVDRRLSEMDAMLTDRIAQIDELKNQLDAIRSGKAVPEIAVKSKESVELPAIVVRSPSPEKKDKSGAAVFLGKVLAINQENKFVIIDIGTNAGVKVGDSFNVYRDNKNIGAISVIQARGDISACDIKRETMPLKIDDGVK